MYKQLIIARKENFFLTDGRYLETAKSVLTIDDEIVVTDISKMSREDYETFFIFCENVGFEENYITYAQYKDYMQKYKVHNFEETDYIIEKQRMIKDEEEIAKITKACEIVATTFPRLSTGSIFSTYPPPYISNFLSFVILAGCLFNT